MNVEQCQGAVNSLIDLIDGSIVTVAIQQCTAADRTSISDETNRIEPRESFSIFMLSAIFSARQLLFIVIKQTILYFARGGILFDDVAISLNHPVM